MAKKIKDEFVEAQKKLDLQRQWERAERKERNRKRYTRRYGRIFQQRLQEAS